MTRFADRIWRATDRAVRMPPLPRDLPVGAVVELPGRGSTYVVDTGDAAKPPLLLLHPLACTGLLGWYPSLPVLRERYRLVIFDQRWHGQGIRSPRFHLDDLAGDAVAVADLLGIDGFVAAGFSMGSLVAQVLAHRHPDRVRGIVLCAGASNFGRTPGAQAALTRAATRAAESAVGARIAAAAPLEASVQGRWAWRQFRSTSPAEVRGAGRVLAGFDSRAWLGELDVPAAVVVTNRDRLIAPRHQHALAARIPGALVYEADSGHASCVLGAERFTPWLAAACASVSARADAAARAG